MSIESWLEDMLNEGTPEVDAQEHIRKVFWNFFDDKITHFASVCGEEWTPELKTYTLNSIVGDYEDCIEIAEFFRLHY